MGGANAGEVASGLAAETLAAEVAKGTPLHAAAEAANAAVFQRAHDNLEQTGMGTTLTAFVLEGDTARFAHIGDSRAYLLRDGELRQVSDDHSLVGEMVRDGRLTEEEAAVHPAPQHPEPRPRHRAAGAHRRVHRGPAARATCCCSAATASAGRCSADAIRVALTRSDPQAAAERLILEARRQGGPDNITAVVVRVDEGPHGAEEDETTLVRPADPEADEATGELPFVVAADEPGGGRADARRRRRARRAPRRAGTASGAPPTPVAEAARRRKRSVRRLGIVAALLALLVVALAAGAFFLSTVFFVGVDDGTLAIYSGVPGKIGPVPLHAVYRRSVVSYDSLSPAARTLVDEQQLRDRESALSLSKHAGDVAVSRRNLELVFLVLAGAVSTMAYVSVYAGRFREINRVSIIYGLVFVAIFVLLHLLERDLPAAGRPVPAAHHRAAGRHRPHRDLPHQAVAGPHAGAVAAGRRRPVHPHGAHRARPHEARPLPLPHRRRRPRAARRHHRARARPSTAPSSGSTRSASASSRRSSPSSRS